MKMKMQTMPRKRWSSILVCLVSFLAFSCVDDTYQSPLASYPVSYSCNITTINATMQQTKQAQLETQGGYVLIPSNSKTLSAGDYVGYGGLLLLQNYEGEFYAYDLTCPYCYAKDKVLHRLSMDGLNAHCTTCESYFGVVMYGSPAPTKGPANEENYILRQYRASLLGDGITLVATQ